MSPWLFGATFTRARIHLRLGNKCAHELEKVSLNSFVFHHDGMTVLAHCKQEGRNSYAITDAKRTGNLRGVSLEKFVSFQRHTRKSQVDMPGLVDVCSLEEDLRINRRKRC